MPYLGLIILAILVIALIDIIGTDDAAISGMPKLAWVFLVVILPLIGALLWLGYGRPSRGSVARTHQPGAAVDFPEYDRPGRYIPADPEADREFLQKLRDRAEEQRRIAREQRRRTEEDPDSTSQA